nr:DUF853 family protein [Lachnospiraceae bacterium]
LIRSKGVGIYFITQNPRDIPDGVLAQLGNKVQHALHAYTPNEQKAMRAVAGGFRENPAFDTYTALGELGTGEALVSVLGEDGVPTMVERVRILPPASKMGAIDDGTRMEMINSSMLFAKYDYTVDNESAFERLTAYYSELEETAAKEREAMERQHAEERERAEAERAAEKERLAAEKAEERERVAAEKAEERARIAAEKAAEKERIAAERAAEKERIAAEKVAEKERIALEKAEAKKAEQRSRAIKSATKSVASSAVGTIGREVGNSLGKSVGGTFGKRLGGNLGASLGRGLIGTLFKL